MASVDLRCPEDPRHLLLKLQLSGQEPVYSPDNLLEIACDSCKSRLRKDDPSIARVLHYFDFVGELIESEVVRR